VPLRGSRHGLAFVTGEIQSATPIYSKLERRLGVQVRNVLVAPLLVGGHSVGTISAANKIDGDHFDQRDMAAFRLFAEVAAVIVRQRVREEILRRGLRRPGGKVADLPVTLSDEDRELLSLFELIGQLRKIRPECLRLIRGFAEGLSAWYRE
jgi:GAF domain-containing protein